MIEFLDPGHETESTAFHPAPRLDSLAGKVVAIVSNGKKGTRTFFDALARALREHHDVAEVIRLTKRNYSAPVEVELLHASARWHALVAGVGD